MKDLKSLVANLGGKIAPNNSIDYKGESVVIDEFAKNIINKVFDQLSVIFPAWKHAWPTEKELSLAKMEWTKAFNENDIKTLEQIKYGFAKARKSESDFLPSCGKFIAWCSPTPEDLGYPSEQQAMNECVKHRNSAKLFGSNARPFIVELCKQLDWWLITTASNHAEHKKVEKHFKDEYMDLINSGYQEPVETTHVRLETREVVRERMTPQQKEDGRKRGIECVKDIKRKLALKKLNKDN